jgi:hypothetical protein
VYCFHRQTFLTVLLLAACSAFAQPKYSTLQNFGMNGPVRSIHTRRDIIAKDPRKQGQRYQPSDICTICAFNRRGNVTENDNGWGPKGINGTTRTTYDSNEWPVETVSFDNNGDQTSRTTSINGPHGPLQSQFWSNGNLIATELHRYDENGNEIFSERKSAGGDVEYECTRRFDDHRNELEAISQGRGFYSRSLNRYRADGTLLEWLTYDHEDNLILHATFNAAGLTSWWMKPHAGVGVGFTISGSQDDTVSVGYSSREDGRVDKYEYRHDGRKGNVEPTVVLLYSPEGQLEEHVGFRYERDAFGNWTVREMTVWDPATGTEVLVHRDARTITYY